MIPSCEGKDEESRNRKSSLGVTGMRLTHRLRWVGWSVLLAFICHALVAGSSVHADQDKQVENGAGGGRMIVVSVPQLSFREISPEQLKALPNLKAMIASGGIGAMNIRTPERGAEDVYMAISAGAPAISRYEVPALQQGESWYGESAEMLYERYTGMEAGQGPIWIPEGPRMVEENKASSYNSMPGLLGDWLARHGIGRYVFGNTDAGLWEDKPNAQGRHAALMLMGSTGQVPAGEISRPQGVATRYPMLLNQLGLLPSRSVALVELGDLNRLYGEQGRYTEARFEQMKQAVLAELDAFVGEVHVSLAPGEQLLLFSPYVHEQAAANKQYLAPLILTQPEMSESLARSATTRQPGIVSLYDLAPVILTYFGIPIPTEMIGKPLTWEKKVDAYDNLYQELEHIRTVYDLRPDLLYPFVIYQVLLLLIALVFAVAGWKRWAKLLRLLLLSILAAPAVMLVLGYIPAGGNWTVTAFLLIWVLLAVMISGLGTVAALAVTCTLNSGLILVDGFMGAPGMKRSVLGYDVMIGARYYGIGNELMGVLIGAVILGVSCLLHQWQVRGKLNQAGSWAKWGAAALFVLTVVYLAAPSLGTNAGGAISAVVTFGIAWMRMFVWKPERPLRFGRLAGFLVVLGVGALLVLWVLHRAMPGIAGEESHIGRAMRWLTDGEFDMIWSLIVRKLAMNWHLIGVSAWSKVLISSILVIAVMVLRPRGLFVRWQRMYPYFMFGYSASAIGAITALLVNDSGIVAAATMIIFIAVPMLIFKLDAAGRIEEAPIRS